MQLGQDREAEGHLLELAACKSADTRVCLDAVSGSLESPGLNGAVKSAAFLLLQQNPSECELPVRLVELILGKGLGESQPQEDMALDILKNDAVMISVLQVVFLHQSLFLS